MLMAALWSNEHAHRGHGAMVQGLVCKQHRVLDEHGAGSQDEGGEQVDVDVVSGAAELSEKKPRKADKTERRRRQHNKPVAAALLRRPTAASYWGMSACKQSQASKQLTE